MHLIQTPLKELRGHKEEYVLMPAQFFNSYLKFCLQEGLELGAASVPGELQDGYHQQRYGSYSLPGAKVMWKNTAEV